MLRIMSLCVDWVWACVCAYVLCESVSVYVYMIAACMFFVGIGSAGHVNSANCGWLVFLTGQ
jgi:hypothetical protein